MVNAGEQSAITATATATSAAAVEPGAVERVRVSGGGRRLAGQSSDEGRRFTDAEDRSSHSRRGSALEDCSISTSASTSCDAGGAASAGGVDTATERGRKSCVSECSLDDDVVDLEAGPAAEITKASPDKAEGNCRICHLGLDSAGVESGAGIVLGCSCKADLSRAHKQCAETWFKIRGNRICEICGSIACNVAGFCDGEFIEQWNESSNTAAAQEASTEPRRFWQGHRFLNFLLACMVFAFVISWLFHFNVPG